MKSVGLITVISILTLTLVTGCGSDNTLAPFEPEIVTTADAFQFQITDAKDVTVLRSYVWDNASTIATIDHSTALTGGSASVVVQDANDVEVYRSDLKASGTETSSAGAAGAWTVTVSMSSFDGSANFRVEQNTK